jgi:hypothetical protein
VQCRKGRWFWEPPLRFRKSHGQHVHALGTDQEAAWAAARKLTAEMLAAPPGTSPAGTVAWVFEQFFGSKTFLTLASSTRLDYQWLAKRLNRAPIGARTLGQINARSIRPRHADLIYASIFAESGHATAHYCARFARRVWKWAGRAEHVDMLNPWSGMSMKGLPERDQVWTAGQVEAVIAAATELGYHSIAIAVRLAYSFAHRKGDILSLTWAMLDASTRRTSKTGARLPMDVESYPELAAALAAERARQVRLGSTKPYVVLCELNNGKWQAEVFSHHFRRVADAAGVPAALQFRDLRATALTEMKDGGADVIDMATHSGHRTLAMARRYAKPSVEQFKRAAGYRNRPKTDDGTSDGTTEPVPTKEKKGL